MSAFVNIDHVYIIAHPLYEANRIEYIKQHILPYFSSTQYTFITPFWKGVDNVQMITKCLDPAGLYHKLTEGAGFLFLTYYRIMKLFVTSEYQNVLVLESDVQVNQGFEHQLNETIKEWKALPNYQSSMVFLGNGCNLQAPPSAPRTGRLVEMNSSKCTDSMLWSKENIQAILKNMIPIKAPIDWFFNLWFDSMKNHNTHKAYWIEPTIFIQGSQNGAYESEVQ